MNNTEKYLPIGTVVMLKGARKRVMITGFVIKAKDVENKVFDYMGCLFPEGVISSDKNLLFDHEQIENVYYLGYSDDEQKQFLAKLNDYMTKNPNVGMNQQNTVVQNSNPVSTPTPVSNPVNNIEDTMSNINLSAPATAVSKMQQDTAVSSSITPVAPQQTIAIDPVKEDIFSSIPNQ